MKDRVVDCSIFILRNAMNLPRFYSCSIFGRLRPVMMALIFVGVAASLTTMAIGQEAVLKGKIQFDKKLPKSADGKSLSVPFQDVEARLREYVDLPAPKYPAGFERRSPEQKAKWIQEFANSEAGKKHIERNRKLLAAANSFEIKFEKDGSFVIYDVPAGNWAIQGRTDKEIGGVNYAFEVFGELKVQKNVDELALAPIQVEVTPLLKRGDASPRLEVETDNGKPLTRKSFSGSYLLVNFWTSASPSAKLEQKMVQEAFQELKAKYKNKIQLLSINVDKKRKDGIRFLIDNRLQFGSHGFTDGTDHPTIFHYGARRFPSFWLVAPDQKILMSHPEFNMAMRVEPKFSDIVIKRIEGKDTPTLAPKKEAGAVK